MAPATHIPGQSPINSIPSNVLQFMAYQSIMVQCYKDFEGPPWVQYVRPSRQQAAVSKNQEWSQVNSTASAFLVVPNGAASVPTTSAISIRQRAVPRLLLQHLHGALHQPCKWSHLFSHTCITGDLSPVQRLGGLPVLHLGFCPRGGKTAIYIFHGGRTPTYTSKVHHNLGGVWGYSPRKIFDFEYPEITSGVFLDQIFSLQIKGNA